MTCRISIITDIHYSHTPSPLAARKCEQGALLLRQSVERLNREIRPDVVAILGDLIDDPAAADATELLHELRTILDQLQCPWLVIPGNHDPRPTDFFQVLPRVERIDVNGVRFACFVDDEAPGHNATRTDDVFAKMRSFASGHDGPKVALQHVPVNTIRGEACYGYTNYPDVAAAMREHGYTLAISGHYHRGQDLLERDGFTSLVIPALCESPHALAVVAIDAGEFTYELHGQELPEP